MKNPVLSRTTSYGFLAPCQNLEKTNDTIPRKHPDGQKDGQKDGQTLFYRTLSATAGGSISQLRGIAVDNKNKIQYNLADFINLVTLLAYYLINSAYLITLLT